MSQSGASGVAGVTFDSGGNRLVGTLYLARGDEPKPTVLLLHGCPGIEQNGDLAADLRDQDWNALVFHYRGCWGSTGSYDLGTITADVLAAVDYVHAGPFLGIDPDRLVVAGHSMGGRAAIMAAAADDRLRAAVSLSAPATLGGLERLTDRDIEREFTRFLATSPAGLRRQFADIAGRPGPLDLVAAICPRPVLIVHGGADEWVPAAEGRQIYERARDPRRYAEIEGANHAFSWHRRDLRELVVGWLAETGLCRYGSAGTG